jgi:hypothetical protein
MNIEVSRKNLLEHLSKKKQIKKRCYSLFIDFSHAYNSVDRRILHDRIELNILSGWKLKLWKFLIGRGRMKIGKRTV